MVNAQRIEGTICARQKRLSEAIARVASVGWRKIAMMSFPCRSSS
jgi:hypothetical protein